MARMAKGMTRVVAGRAVLAGLAVGALLPRGVGAEGTSSHRPEWVLLLGANSRLGGLDFTDTTAVDNVTASQESHLTSSVNYKGSSRLGVTIGGKAWLPFGLGAYATYLRQSQELTSTAKSSSYIVTATPTGRSSTLYSGGGQTGPLQNTNSQIHIGVGFRTRLSSLLTLEIGAGPTYFSVEQEVAASVAGSTDMCTGSSASRQCTQTIEIDEKDRQTKRAWGFHVSGGLVARISRHTGLDLGLRYSRGKVKLRGQELPNFSFYTEPSQRTDFTPEVGGFAATAGLFVRF
jgi:hypothetical protein